MRKALILLASAAVITGSTLSAEARDRYRDRDDRPEQTTNQLVNEAAVHTARIKVDLHLTADQEKNWPAFESALADLNKRRIDRVMAMRADRKTAGDERREASDDRRNQNDDRRATNDDRRATNDDRTTGSAARTTGDENNVLDAINRDADRRIERANDWKKLTEAARPLYDSLDQQQKRRFAEILYQGDRQEDRARERYSR
ncbi:hypothetical protein HNR60_002581 [Rhodopseudomonas rhenobacensis]|uniref:LTXXQ motif family protein n=1 Tax=Rhodopseudomonas rhenobacensis TaxID=87461 RepID=A0A7W8DYZ6_9BRAD|nr:hypothetical protein [Rhodopseudomonas rhenobacensis]MBB5047824.1 hypothetical protein [Rhodopseudomonas rhenobacensis]